MRPTAVPDRCARRTFAEQIPALTRRQARRAAALTAQLTDVALVLAVGQVLACSGAWPSRAAWP
ncbi:hypothetical protein ACIBOZ_24510 [Streptomyces anulatus]